MIIFLYGEDSFRSQKKLDEIIEQYKKAHKSGLNLIRLEAKGKDFSELAYSFKIVSMFAEKKLVILTNLFLNQKFQEDFLKDIKSLESSKDVIVIFEKDSPDQRSKFFKALKKAVKSQEFNFLDNAKLSMWVDKELESHKSKIDPLAKNIFLGCVGSNLWLAENEIKKLANFKPGCVINKEDVQLMVRPKIENDIFKTIDAIAQKDKKLALQLLHKHVEGGDNVLYLLSMVSYQFRNLLVIKDLMEKRNTYEQIVKKSGLHPFVVKKNYYLCNQFQDDQLKKIYQKIFLIDSDIKTGKIDPETALDLLISEI